eukprot:362251-Chlamydomonas_euryale.AAC.8
MKGGKETRKRTGGREKHRRERPARRRREKQEGRGPHPPPPPSPAKLRRAERALNKLKREGEGIRQEARSQQQAGKAPRLGAHEPLATAHIVRCKVQALRVALSLTVTGEQIILECHTWVHGMVAATRAFVWQRPQTRYLERLHACARPSESIGWLLAHVTAFESICTLG